MAKAYKIKRKSSTPSASIKSSSMQAPTKLYLLFTIIPREKTEFYVDLLQRFEVNIQMILAGKGTASSNIQGLLGLGDSEKSVIISVIKRENTAAALAELDNKFTTIKGGKGIAYTVPMKSTIGVAIYQFLSNTTSGGLI